VKGQSIVSLSFALVRVHVSLRVLSTLTVPTIRFRGPATTLVFTRPCGVPAHAFPTLPKKSGSSSHRLRALFRDPAWRRLLNHQAPALKEYQHSMTS
jgi:hypothetical protein